MASKALSLTLYNLALPLGLVLMLPGAFIKMRRRNGRWQDLAQRYGQQPLLQTRKKEKAAMPTAAATAETAGMPPHPQNANGKRAKN